MEADANARSKESSFLHGRDLCFRGFPAIHQGGSSVCSARCRGARSANWRNANKLKLQRRNPIYPHVIYPYIYILYSQICIQSLEPCRPIWVFPYQRLDPGVRACEIPRTCWVWVKMFNHPKCMAGYIYIYIILYIYCRGYAYLSSLQLLLVYYVDVNYDVSVCVYIYVCIYIYTCI